MILSYFNHNPNGEYDEEELNFLDIYDRNHRYKLLNS